MLQKLVLITVTFMFSTGAFAANINYVNQSNPAAISATLERSCAELTDRFVSNLPKLTAKVAYLKDLRMMQNPDWKTIEANEGYKDETKSVSLSMNTNFEREFPATFLSLDASRRTCAKKRDGQAVSMGCLDSTTFIVNGSSAVVYEKTVEARRGGKWLDSFTLSFNFSNQGPTACILNTSLSINNSGYLWAKKHLIKDIDPTLIEKKILSRFVDWSKELANDLEVL